MSICFISFMFMSVLLPRDVRDDDTVRPEEDVGRLAVVGEVLDVDRLLVQHEDVPGHLVSRVRELAQVDWLRLGLARQRAEAGQNQQCSQLLFVNLQIIRRSGIVRSSLVSPFQLYWCGGGGRILSL